MLAERFGEKELKDMLVETWHPYPTAKERAGWDALPERIREAYVARGEKALHFDWPSIPATLFLDYHRTGNRTRFQNERNKRRHALADLVLAECVEGKGRFVDQIVNGVWITCEETYWGVPAHLRLQSAGKGLPDAAEPTVDLFAAETSALLAWTHYLIGDTFAPVSPLVLPRIEMEIDRRILTPLLEREDFNWMGFQMRDDGRRVNNWNPWINSNWLLSFLLIEEDRDRLIQGIAKSLRCLDHFIDPYPRDGGCDEGPGYWGRAAAALFDCLEILHSATDGGIDVFDDELLRNMGSFIYKLQAGDRYFVNFADAPALATPSPSIVYRYGKRVGDEKMAAFGAWLAEQSGVAQNGFGDSVARQLPALFTADELIAAEGYAPLPRDTWFPDIEVMAARDTEGTTEGFFVAAKGGTNQESHNHNDIGNFVVYADGKPLLIDTGVEPYTAKNSSSERYDIWTMSSDYHNVPQVNGHPPGFEHCAADVSYKADDASATFSLDIAQAYGDDAGIEKWVRTIDLMRGEGVRVEDAYTLKNAGPIALHFMTACDVNAEARRVTLLEREMADGRMTGSGTIEVEEGDFVMEVEEVSLVGGERLHMVWGEKVMRIRLVAEGTTKGRAVVRIRR